MKGSVIYKENFYSLRFTIFTLEKNRLSIKASLFIWRYQMKTDHVISSKPQHQKQSLNFIYTRLVFYSLTVFPYIITYECPVWYENKHNIKSQT